METGLRIHDPGSCFPGYTLYCPSIPKFAPSETPEGEIYLIDMDGELVHRWPVHTALQSFCRLLPNGNLLYPTNDRSDLGSARRVLPRRPPGAVGFFYSPGGENQANVSCCAMRQSSRLASRRSTAGRRLA